MIKNYTSIQECPGKNMQSGCCMDKKIVWVKPGDDLNHIVTNQRILGYKAVSINFVEVAEDTPADDAARAAINAHLNKERDV